MRRVRRHRGRGNPTPIDEIIKPIDEVHHGPPGGPPIPRHKVTPYVPSETPLTYLQHPDISYPTLPPSDYKKAPVYRPEIGVVMADPYEKIKNEYVPYQGPGSELSPSNFKEFKSAGKKKSLLHTVHRFVKDKRLISRGLRVIGAHKQADFAEKLGYGKKKTRRRRK